MQHKALDKFCILSAYATDIVTYRNWIVSTVHLHFVIVITSKEGICEQISHNLVIKSTFWGLYPLKSHLKFKCNVHHKSQIQGTLTWKGSTGMWDLQDPPFIPLLLFTSGVLSDVLQNSYIQIQQIKMKYRLQHLILSLSN